MHADGLAEIAELVSSPVSLTNPCTPDGFLLPDLPTRPGGRGQADGRAGGWEGGSAVRVGQAGRKEGRKRWREGAKEARLHV